MIDAQSLDLILGHEFQDQTMCSLKYFRQFHAQRDQFGDIEKAAVIELFSANTPEGQTIMLLLEKLKELIECRGLSRHAVELLQT